MINDSAVKKTKTSTLAIHVKLNVLHGILNFGEADRLTEADRLNNFDVGDVLFQQQQWMHDVEESTSIL